MAFSHFLARLTGGHLRPNRRQFSSISGQVETLEQRAVLTELTGHAGGQFWNPGSNSDAASSPVTTGMETNQITFGSADFDTPPSSLSFVPAATLDFEVGQVVSLGSLTFFNGIVGWGTAIDSIDLNVSIDFNEPLGISQQIFQIPLGILNTLNTGDPIADSDSVSLTPGTTVGTFTAADGSEYALELVGFGVPNQGEADSQLVAQENSSASIELLVRIVPSGSDIPFIQKSEFQTSDEEPAVIAFSSNPLDFQDTLTIDDSEEVLTQAEDDGLESDNVGDDLDDATNLQDTEPIVDDPLDTSLLTLDDTQPK